MTRCEEIPRVKGDGKNKSGRNSVTGGGNT